VEKLKTGDDERDRVYNTYQLFGVYLLFKRSGLSSKEHHDLFWHWLADKGVTAHRSAIVRAIAEKAA
jgi:hypothetical protein